MKDVVKSFGKFTGKQLWQSLYFNKVAGLCYRPLFKKRLWHRYFPVNFAKLSITNTFLNIPHELFHGGGPYHIETTP